MPWIVAGAVLGITLLRASEAVEERINREFQQRLYILRTHSGSIRTAPSRPGPDPIRPDTGATRSRRP
jgi:hypothetical protein